MSAVAGEYGPRYEVLGEIERRDTGVLLETRDIDLGRLVTLEVLRESLTEDPEAVARFVDEARIVGRLQHPGIVPVYDLGRADDDRPFFVMKRVRGESLASILAARERSEDDRPRLLWLFEQVAQAVAYAHARGVMHGALGTETITIGAFGEVQIEGWRAAGDQEADVAALGRILGEILTGSAGRVDVDAGVKHDEALLTLVRRCLAPRHASGAPSAEEVVAVVAEHRTEVMARTHRSRLRAIEERGRAERARAEAAEARVAAAAERKARYRTLLLSAAILIAIVVAAVAWWAVEESRAESDRRASEAVEVVLLQATRLAAAQRWPAALAAAQRASELAGASRVRDGVRERAATVLAEVQRAADAVLEREARAAADAAAIRCLEAIRIGGHEGSLAPLEADAAHAAVFRELGLEPAGMKAGEAALVIRRRDRPLELVASVDAWASARRRLAGVRGGRGLTDVAKTVDPDPKREAIREAGLHGDLELLYALAMELEVGRHPPQTLSLLGMHLNDASASEAAARLLGRALLHHPDDLWIVFELGRGLAESEPPRHREALRCFKAAVALRPESPGLWRWLGTSRKGIGQAGPAEAAFRRADALAKTTDSR